MKPKKQKQAEALARRLRDLALWKEELTILSTKNRVSPWGASRGAMSTPEVLRKIRVASDQVQRLQEKLA